MVAVNASGATLSPALVALAIGFMGPTLAHAQALNTYQALWYSAQIVVKDTDVTTPHQTVPIGYSLMGLPMFFDAGIPALTIQFLNADKKIIGTLSGFVAPSAVIPQNLSGVTVVRS